MEDKQVLFNNIDKVHTTEMGIDRIANTIYNIIFVKGENYGIK